MFKEATTYKLNESGVTVTFAEPVRFDEGEKMVSVIGTASKSVNIAVRGAKFQDAEIEHLMRSQGLFDGAVSGVSATTAKMSAPSKVEVDPEDEEEDDDDDAEEPIIFNKSAAEVLDAELNDPVVESRKVFKEAELMPAKKKSDLSARRKK